MTKLFHGNDQFLSIQAAKEYLKKIQAESSDSITEVINADETSSEDIINKLTIQDIFSPGKIIFLKRLYSNKEKEHLIPYILESIPKLNTKTKLIIWEDSKINSITKYIKFFKTKNNLETFEKLNKRTFVTWLKEILSQNEIQYSTPTIKIFSERSNYNTERASNEIDKLKLAEVTELTEENLSENTTDTLELDIWKLIDTINSDNSTGNAIAITNKLLKSNVEPLFILAMITRNTRLLVQVKYLSEKGYSSKEISSILRIPPFTTPSLLRSTSNTTMKQLKYIYEKLSSLDYEIKRGQIDPELGLILLVTRL